MNLTNQVFHHVREHGMPMSKMLCHEGICPVNGNQQPWRLQSILSAAGRSACRARSLRTHPPRHVDLAVDSDEHQTVHVLHHVREHGMPMSKVQPWRLQRILSAEGDQHVGHVEKATSLSGSFSTLSTIEEATSLSGSSASAC